MTPSSEKSSQRVLDKFFKLLWPGTRRAFASNGILLAEKFSPEGEEGFFSKRDVFKRWV